MVQKGTISSTTVDAKIEKFKKCSVFLGWIGITLSAVPGPGMEDFWGRIVVV
jgi:hypothetical protein